MQPRTARRRERRRPTIPLPTMLLVLGVCFFLGLFTVLTLEPPGGEGDSVREPTAERQPSATAADAGQDLAQVSVLILGVDRLQVPDPELRAVWIATFRPPGRDVFVLGVPVDFDAGGGATLASLFQWMPSGGVEATFLAGLRQASPLAPQAILVTDEVGFAALVDYMGGVPLNEATLSGSQAVEVLDLMASDPRASLVAQAEMLRALARRVSALGTSPDLTPLLALVPEHGYLSVPLNQLIGLVSPVLPLQPTSIHVDLLVPPGE